MQRHLALLVCLSVGTALSAVSCFAQAGASGAKSPADLWSQGVPKPPANPAPAPKHDLAGTWTPAAGPGAGIQAAGVAAMPNDGKPEHQPPYSDYGMQVYKAHHALEGADAVLPGFYDDPRDKCEPMGFPRANFYNLRETQIFQDEYKIAILYQYDTKWRIIWIDGRPVPENIDGGVKAGKELKESRYYGYSVGHWTDDPTLVVDTLGMMPESRVWLDTAGRPISDKAHITETFHRVNHDRLEWTVTIDDPKMYTKPWVAMNKFPMMLESPQRDIMEQYCSLTEMEEYNKVFANPSSGK
jgi:hypothetical protein